MENNEINFSVFDNMIHTEPMRWQSLECDLEGNTFFLQHINNYLKYNPIHELFVDEVPEEYEYLFEDCTIEELTDIRDELLVCLN
jgi:CDP-diacylglycerol pyrophosphatase|tara:strand:- start:2166 stop:2420 length:255 start_codon:yes stop_codon:yes gene_type:complete